MFQPISLVVGNPVIGAQCLTILDGAATLEDVRSARDPDRPPATGPEWNGSRAFDVPVAPGGTPNPLEARTSDVPILGAGNFQDLPEQVFHNGHDGAFDVAFVEQDDAGPPLEPNPRDITRHLYALFQPDFVKDYPDAWIEIAIANPAAGEGKIGPKASRHFSPFELDKAAAYTARRNREGKNVYVGVALRQGETGEFSNGRATKDNYLTSSRAWGDFDKHGDSKRISDFLAANQLEPAETVITGTVPHVRFQLFFRLDGNATMEQLESVNAAIRDSLGGNGDGVQNCDRLMRLAGTVSYPPPDKAARGYIPELTTLHLRKDAQAYTIEQLMRIAGIGTATAGQASANPATASPGLNKPTNPFGFDTAIRQSRSDDELIEKLEASCTDGEWHNNIRDAIATMIGRGWSDSAIRFACAPYCRDGYGDTDLDDFIDRGRAKWNKPNPPEPDAPDFKPPPSKLPWLDMSNWDNEPVPERKWAIRDRVPLNQVGLFSGEGGTGKSIIELMKNVAHVMARDWLGSLPEQGPAFYLGAEDDSDELHIRLAAIAKHYGVSFEELIRDGLHVLPLLGQDATLCALNPRTGRVGTTALYHQIYEAAGDLKPKNISIDTLSRAFAGDEINRVQVYAFAMHMQALAKVASGSVTVLSHPSLAGMSSGSGISGSTAWHGAFRFRQYLKGVKAEEGEQPDNDLRELEFKKNQYGPLGESIALHYKDGLFLPVVAGSSFEKLAREATADSTFIDLLWHFFDRGIDVSHSPSSIYYAPKLFAETEQAKKHRLRKADFEMAMKRLLTARKIIVTTYGKASRQRTRLGVLPANSTSEKE